MTRFTAVVPLLLMSLPLARAAQEAASLSGIVRDSSGRALVGAAVVVDPETNPRTTRTGGDGRFRLEGLNRGRHRLRVTWIGYEPGERDIELNESSVSIDVVLTPLAFQLDTMSVVARRRGILGRVHMAPTLDPLANVTVEVLGTRWRMRTKADGVFEFPDLPEGGYVVQVRHDGYRTKTISARVPPDGAVEVIASMDTIRGDRDKGFESLLRDMERRLNRGRSNDRVLVAYQELAVRPGIMLDDAMRFAPSAWGKGMILLTGFICSIYIDGVEDRVIRLRDIRAADVLAMEVYRTNGCAEDAPGRPGIRVIRPNGKPGYNLYIWFKRS